MAAPKNKRRELKLEGVRLLFRNFAGKEGMYNAAGDRFFHVAVDEALGLELEEEGWNVKWLNSREDEPPLGHIKCSVNFDKDRRPPKIFLLTDEGRYKTRLTEEVVELADLVDVEEADVILGAYHWESKHIGKGWGIKAYANEVVIKVRESDLDRKYRDAQELPVGGSRAPLEIEAGEPYELEDLGEI